MRIKHTTVPSILYMIEGFYYVVAIKLRGLNLIHDKSESTKFRYHILSIDFNSWPIFFLLNPGCLKQFAYAHVYTIIDHMQYHSQIEYVMFGLNEI